MPKSSANKKPTHWIEPNYKDEEWLNREARTCQFCKKAHDTPAEASSCIESHSCVRCYFCFRIFATEETLKEHLETIHGTNGHALCPICDKTIPVETVCGHVVCFHLSVDSETEQKSAKKLKVVYFDGSDSESDSDEPKYSDQKWFNRAARICQYCKKKHESPADASMCMTSHGRLRCYFCFTGVRDTDDLFKHFEIDHKQHKYSENSLSCPYCQEIVPYKLVSCHVISAHLMNRRFK